MNTKALRQKILDLAIHGKLVPQDPNDEPASVLLERIRDEKERLIKEGKIKRPKKSKATSDKPHYPYELPKGWAWCKLSDCCHIVGRIGFRGYTKDDLVEFQKGAITLSPSNIIDGEMDYNKCTYISWDKYEESPEIEVLEGDILLVKTGSSFGKCALVDKLPWKSTINPQFVILKYISINEQYLTWVLQSSYARNNYNDFVLGTAIPTFTQVVLGNMPIPLPPISEQLKIVKKLKHLFLSINSLEDNKKSLCTLIKESKSKVLDLAIHGKLVPQDPMDEPASELLKRITPKTEITCDNGHYQKLPFKIPKSWVWCGHNDILEISGGSQPAKNHFISVPKDNYIRLYQIRDYGDNPIPVYIPEELASKRTEKGDILLARYGGSLGKVFHAETGAYNVAMAKVILKYPNVIFKDFAYYYYLSDLYQGRLKEISRTAQAGFNSSDFNEMFFPLPPYEEQKRIVNAINKTFTILDTIMENL